jgi:hypothetical protein
MATFFGLTALGPANTFKASLKGQATLHWFPPEDLKAAFDKAQEPRSIRQVLEIMYLGPVPEVDMLLFSEAFSGGDSFGWKELKMAFDRARQNIEDGQDPSSKSNYFGSYQDYREAMQRHKRGKHGPYNVLEQPLTVSQEYGWNIGNSTMSPHRILGKKSCPETIYAAKLIKSNVC